MYLLWLVSASLISKNKYEIMHKKWLAENTRIPEHTEHN